MKYRSSTTLLANPTNNFDHLKKKKHENFELVGSFAIRDDEDNYQFYQIRHTGSVQSDFISLLLNYELLFLIVIMIISIPLLILYRAYWREQQQNGKAGTT